MYHLKKLLMPNRHNFAIFLLLLLSLRPWASTGWYGLDVTFLSTTIRSKLEGNCNKGMIWFLICLVSNVPCLPNMSLNPEFHWLRQIATTLCEFHWRFWIIFLDAIAKAKKLICESIAQNLKQVSLTKSFIALAMAFNLLLSNPT